MSILLEAPVAAEIDIFDLDLVIAPASGDVQGAEMGLPGPISGAMCTTGNGCYTLANTCSSTCKSSCGSFGQTGRPCRCF
ncbi:hypothetical protein ACFW1A_13310 [Kitasatospora sp. NPDC058965]|uniref:hypothetical protein n=1 Tax=Kitasatospora sp. NPDC058965 TaxID=3346682 RepID=UPI0036CEA990